jgi:hypothetical protein
MQDGFRLRLADGNEDREAGGRHRYDEAAEQHGDRSEYIEQGLFTITLVAVGTLYFELLALLSQV